MKHCVYCTNKATTEDALGLPACKKHKREADNYYQQRTGRTPDEDSFLYCDKHLDLWQSGCPRCEECCQHHYGCNVKEKFGEANTPEERGVKVEEFEIQRRAE